MSDDPFYPLSLLVEREAAEARGHLVALERLPGSLHTEWCLARLLFGLVPDLERFWIVQRSPGDLDIVTPGFAVPREVAAALDERRVAGTTVGFSMSLKALDAVPAGRRL